MFWNFDLKFSDFKEKVFGKVDNTSLYESRAIFSDKELKIWIIMPFLDSDQKRFGLWHPDVQQSCQNCFLRVWRIILGIQIKMFCTAKIFLDVELNSFVHDLKTQVPKTKYHFQIKQFFQTIKHFSGFQPRLLRVTTILKKSGRVSMTEARCYWSSKNSKDFWEIRGKNELQLFSSIVKTAFYVSAGKHWSNDLNFSHTFQKAGFYEA